MFRGDGLREEQAKKRNAIMRCTLSAEWIIIDVYGTLDIEYWMTF